MITKESLNSHIGFICEKCDYKCFRKSDYTKHLTTNKHKNNDDQLHKTLKKYTCSCGKEYSFRQGLYLHKKKCKEQNNSDNESVNKETNSQITPELIMSVLQQNKELQQMLIEQNKTIIELSKNNSITNNNTNNSHNKTFNLQFFLNETCKDAMNIMDFVESIKVQLCDLEKVGQIGYVEGISNIIVKNLNSLDETKRPVHCTDSKREVLYVKDEDKWEKENNDKQKLRKVIKEVAYKNTKMLKEYKSIHPDCDKSESRFSDQYNKLIIEAMGGKGDNDLEKEDKIIKNIAKEVTIEK